MNSQARRANMKQLQQAAPVASSFPFDDPALQLEDILPPAALSMSSFGYVDENAYQMPELDQDQIGMEHKSSTEPYDPLSKYGLTNGENLMDMFMGGDTRQAKHAMFVGENPIDEFGNQRPVYDPAIEQAFVPIDLIAGAGLPSIMKEVGESGKESVVNALKSMIKSIEADNGF